MSTKNRGFRRLTGGALGDLDYFPVAGVTDDDAAFGIVAGLYHPYFYDASLVIAANNSPYQIIPADNATGTGAWVLGGFQGANTHVFAKETAGASIVKDTPTTLIFDSESYDYLLEHNSATGIFTALHDGIYEVVANLRLVSVAWTAGNITVIIANKNTGGGNVEYSRGIYWTAQASATYIAPMSFSGKIELAAGDTFGLSGNHSRTGGNVTISDGYLYIDRIA